MIKKKQIDDLNFKSFNYYPYTLNTLVHKIYTFKIICPLKKTNEFDDEDIVTFLRKVILFDMNLIIHRSPNIKKAIIS